AIEPRVAPWRLDIADRIDCFMLALGAENSAFTTGRIAACAEGIAFAAAIARCSERASLYLAVGGHADSALLHGRSGQGLVRSVAAVRVDGRIGNHLFTGFLPLRHFLSEAR